MFSSDSFDLLQFCLSGRGGMDMSDQQDAVVISLADWLSELSEQARAQGHVERAGRLLLLAWQAYDGQKVSLDALDGDVVGRDKGSDGSGSTIEFCGATR